MMDFSNLTEKRKRWVESNQENGFDEGITNLLIELYPDNAHFIYELLQNSEDANATEVSFELLDNELRFSHNGKLFDYDDIEGITSIGQGTKANDINKIGKFGVGFKAVFAYTSTPRIYSGDYNFDIVDLVVPLAIKNNLDNHQTLMVFPFNHNHRDINKKKTREQAYTEIKDGLEEIEDNVLLFLTSIQKLKFSFDGKQYTIERIENEEKVKIINSKKSTTTHWLRFKKYLKGSQKLYVSVAYNLDNKEERIQPINGEVSIFFPAEKESSNLKFHIHAPFSSTVARDSIKDLKENNDLRDLISELICETLVYIKGNSLLNYSFMSCLPNNDDNLSSFYLPIQNAIIEKFNEYNYIQISDEVYKPASQCYIGSKAIKEFIDIDLLKKFIYFDSRQTIERELNWVDKIPKTGSREYKFMDTLNIGKFTDKVFSDILDKLVDGWVAKGYYNNLEILKEQSEEWFSKLYAYCYIQYHNNCISNLENYKKIIKLFDGSLNLEQKTCYFSDTQFSDYLIINSTFKENEQAYEFLKLLSVREIEQKEKIETKLKEKYISKNFPNEDEHLADVRNWIEYYKSASEKDIDFFKEYSFLKVIDKDSKVWWGKVDIVYIDEPFLRTGMGEFILENRVYLLDSIYLKLEKEEQKYFIIMLKLLGANIEISIEKTVNTDDYKVYDNYQILRERLNFPTESDNCRFSDYYFSNLPFILKSFQNKKISLLIWNQVRALPKSYFIAKYKAHARSGEVKTSSTLVTQLKEQYFILDKNGNYHQAQNISKEMLPDEFIYDNRNGWLTAISFGEDVRKNEEEYKEKEKIIGDITGHSLEDIEQLKDVDPERLQEFLRKEKEYDLFGAIGEHEGDENGEIGDLDPSIVHDREKYLKKAQEKLEQTVGESITESKKYISTVKVKLGRKETKFFLGEQYRGYCQICGFTFLRKKKIREGKGYFELFDFLGEKISKQKNNFVEAGSSLCLCSRCHSSLKYGSFTATFKKELEDTDLTKITFDEFLDKVNILVKEEDVPECYGFIEMDMYKVAIQLLGEDKFIYYTEEHFLHMYTMLKSRGE